MARGTTRQHYLMSSTKVKFCKNALTVHPVDAGAETSKGIKKKAVEMMRKKETLVDPGFTSEGLLCFVLLFFFC